MTSRNRAAPANKQHAEQSGAGAPTWVLPALGGLLLLAAVVIFWLPQRVSTPPPAVPTPAPGTTPRVNTGSSDNAAANPAATEDASPWSEAQLAKLRKEAQDVLQELLEIQFALEESGAQQWAAEEFAAAGAIAAAGDELYKTREYEAAKAQYQESLTAFKTLQDSIPQRLATQLQAATDAIEAGDIAAAEAALDWRN